VRRLPIYVIALVGAAIFLIPFVWTVSTALKTRQQVFATPPQWIPRSFSAWYDTEKGRELLPVSVVNRIDAPAALVKLTGGPREGQTLAVDQKSVTKGSDGVIRVKLKAPNPFTADVLQDFPAGVAQVRASGQPATKAERFVAPSELVERIDPQWGNFKTAWTALPMPFHRFVLNTYTITIINIVGQTLSCSLVAYGFARFKFRGRKALFMLLLSTLMLPPQVTMIPVFLIWQTLGLVDTFAPLTVPGFFAQSAFFVFLLRQFFMGLPRDLDEAAMIDGCSPLRIWWQILMPLSKPALTTVAVLSFIGHWDDFVGPLIYLNRLENYTVSLALRLFQDQNGTEFNLLMAAALVHIVPVLILFFVAQRYFVKGIAMSGLKG